jgi:hypothetical protein
MDKSDQEELKPSVATFEGNILMPTVQVKSLKEWIPVSERLPELTEQVHWYNGENQRVPWEGRFEVHVLGYDPKI